MPWRAEHVVLRSAANASQQIRRHRRQPPALARTLQRWMVQSINLACPLFPACEFAVANQTALTPLSSVPIRIASLIGETMISAVPVFPVVAA